MADPTEVPGLKPIMIGARVPPDVNRVLEVWAAEKEWSKSFVVGKILTAWADEHYPDREKEPESHGSRRG